MHNNDFTVAEQIVDEEITPQREPATVIPTAVGGAVNQTGASNHARSMNPMAPAALQQSVAESIEQLQALKSRLTAELESVDAEQKELLQTLKLLSKSHPPLRKRGRIRSGTAITDRIVQILRARGPMTPKQIKEVLDSDGAEKVPPGSISGAILTLKKEGVIVSEIGVSRLIKEE